MTCESDVFLCFRFNYRKIVLQIIIAFRHECNVEFAKFIRIRMEKKRTASRALRRLFVVVSVVARSKATKQSLAVLLTIECSSVCLVVKIASLRSQRRGWHLLQRTEHSKRITGLRSRARRGTCDQSLAQREVRDLANVGVSEYWLTRLCFQRALAFIYLIAFLIAANQFRALAGSRGLLPAPLFLKRVGFWDAPSLFWFHYSDRLALLAASFGIFLSLFALTGLSESFGLAASMIVWLLLWVLYHSFVSIGQTFYGFGWEFSCSRPGFSRSSWVRETWFRPQWLFGCYVGCSFE